jgi:hypothetical protein
MRVFWNMTKLPSLPSNVFENVIERPGFSNPLVPHAGACGSSPSDHFFVAGDVFQVLYRGFSTRPRGFSIGKLDNLVGMDEGMA